MLHGLCHSMCAYWRKEYLKQAFKVILASVTSPHDCNCTTQTHTALGLRQDDKLSHTLHTPSPKMTLTH